MTGIRNPRYRKVIAAVVGLAAAGIVTALPGVRHGSAGTWPSVPDPSLTPGATLHVTAADVCVVGYTKTVRNVPTSLARQAFAEYHTPFAAKGKGELDHLISLELGGSNDLANLWPQYGPRPNSKDSLENSLHRQVCNGEITLARAQRLIVDPANWP